MIIKLLGFLDLMSGIILALLHFNIISWNIAFGFALYLIFKGIIFKADFMSLFDLLMGVYMVLMLFGIRTFISFIFLGYSAYKTIISFFF